VPCRFSGNHVNRALVSATALCLLGVASSVWAQEEPDPLELARVRLGRFAFTPAVFTTRGYDSNVTRGPGDIGDYDFVALFAQATHDRFVFSPERDGTSVQLAGSVTIDSPALISGAALVGCRRFSASASRVQDFSGVVAAINLAYTRETRTRVLVAVERQPYFSYSESLGYYVLTSVAAGYVQTLFEDGEASVFPGGHPLDYSQADLPAGAHQREIRTDVGAGVSWRTGAFMRPGVNLLRVAYHGGMTFHAWRAIAYVGYGSDRFLRLDRPLPKQR
jgi:hypothetical protein